MKKILTTLFVSLCVISVSAQITFWASSTQGIYETSDSVTWEKVRDTIVAYVPFQFEYEDVDEITFALPSGNTSNDSYAHIYIWKNGEKIPAFSDCADRIVINNAAYQDSASLPYYPMYYPIDSIVWHPYALDTVFMGEGDSFPIVSLYGETKEYIYPIYPEPRYSSFSYTFANSDTTVAKVEVVKLNYNETTLGPSYNPILSLHITPLHLGSTTVTLTFNNTIRKQFNVVIAGRPTVQDETSISLDSLYNKIYSRLTITGNQLPYGQCDISGVDEGTTAFYRMMHELQELPADQLSWVWNDPGVIELNQNAVTASNVLVEGLFRRLYYNIYLCNSYLNRSEGITSLVTKRAEVRFLRAYFYYYLLDMFGSVPVVEHNADFTATPQSPRTDVYNFVVNELLTCADDLPVTKSDYYGLDKAAAWLLLSRVYLNAEVYTGTAHYNEAAQYAAEVINSNYRLASQYKYLFMADNNGNAVNDANNEIIFAAKEDGINTASWGGSRYLISSMAFGYADIGLADTWCCTLARKQLSALFYPAATEPYPTADELYGTDNRALLLPYDLNGNSQNMTYNGRYGYDNWYGWKINKWTNIAANPTILPSDPQWPDTDIPLLRKAEAYLNYAEAVLRGGAQRGDLTALLAVNMLRTRANAAQWNEVTLDNILDERGREFYAEGHRRTDLIRFGKFGGQSSYLWNMQGGAINGQAFPASQNVYPIPQNLLNAVSGGGVQNAGY